MIAQPLELVAAEPFADVQTRLKELIRDKQVELILVGVPRNMNGSYGPAALKVQDFVAALRGALTVPDQDLGRAAHFGAGQPLPHTGQRAPRET